MPRRPRPTTRQPPNSTKPTTKKVGPKQQHAKIPPTKLQSSSEDDSDEVSINHFDESTLVVNTGSGSSAGGSEDEGAEGLDVDAPRVAQWEPDEFDLYGSASDDEDSGDDMQEELSSRAGPSHEKLNTLQDDLHDLPLGALRKAHRTLAQTQAISDSESDESSEDEPAEKDLKGKQKEKPEWNLKPRKDLAKRANKHAPQEVTSKRPVTRRRTVVDVKTQTPRDPRFLPVTGEFSNHKFREQYGFLSELHSTELKTLRENLKRARKMLASSPRDLREERQEEVNRLELAVKRAESSVNRDRREMVERDALSTYEKEEREKRKQGKGGWWMKGSDKKDMLVRARYNALAASGGRIAVKKAIEKKQKKISQKEKKSRPFAKERSTPGAFSSTGDKRPRSSGFRDEGGHSKRRRID